MAQADVLRRIERYNRGREPERLAIMYAKMRQSPVAFFRSNSEAVPSRPTGSCSAQQPRYSGRKGPIGVRFFALSRASKWERELAERARV
jgi:hypothetical protein